MSMNLGAHGGRDGGRSRSGSLGSGGALGAIGPGRALIAGALVSSLALALAVAGPAPEGRPEGRSELRSELRTDLKLETRSEARPELGASRPADGGAPHERSLTVETRPRDGGAPPDARAVPPGPARVESAGPPRPEPPRKLPPVIEEPLPPRAAQRARGKAARTLPVDYLLELQNYSGAVARRFVQHLLVGRFDEALHMLEEQGGRRPDWVTLSRNVQAQLDTRGAPQRIEQLLTTTLGAELQTFYFTVRYPDGSELGARVAVDHGGHVAGAALGPDVIPAEKKRYDRHDNYVTKARLVLPFSGTWTVSNATPGAGNGHYLNANQRFAIDFFITEEIDGKRKSHRDSGKQNADYFAYGQDVLAPADGTVLVVVDGVLDNTPGNVDVYYRLGNSIVLAVGQGEYVHLCHLMPGSMRVRIGDRVVRGQVIAKVGNSGNSTAPHLHFQVTDGPLITYAASLPAYFTRVVKDGSMQQAVLLRTGDRVANPETARRRASSR